MQTTERLATIPISADQVCKINTHWRPRITSFRQIYLINNPLLNEALNLSYDFIGKKRVKLIDFGKFRYPMQLPLREISSRNPHF